MKTQLKFEKEKGESMVGLEGELLVVQQQVDLWEATFRELVEDAVSTTAAGTAGTGAASAGGTAAGAPGGSNQKKHTVVKALNFEDMESFDHPAGKNSISITPALVLHLISQQQNKCAMLAQETGVANAKVQETQRDMRHVQERVVALSRESADLTVRHEKMTQEHANLKHVSSLYDKEISSLRGLVRSYEQELTLGKPDAAHALGIQEKVLQQLRNEFDAQRTELAELMALHPNTTTGATAATATSAASASTLEEQVSSLTSSLDTTKSQVLSLKNQLYHISMAAGGIDFAPGLTRVLHFTNNPHSMLRAAREGSVGTGTAATAGSTLPPVALKLANAEIRRLKDCIAAANSMASTHGGDGGVPSGASGDESMVLNQSILDTTTTPHTGSGAVGGGGQSVGSSKVSRGLASVGADSVKLNLRLKEMFRERITLFREAVYLLTGFKVDLIFDNEAGQGKAHPKVGKA